MGVLAWSDKTLPSENGVALASTCRLYQIDLLLARLFMIKHGVYRISQRKVYRSML